MATGKGKTATESKVASALPDDFVAGGGLADDFDGKIVEARYVPWDYNGNIDTPVLAARLTIERDNDGETEQVVQHYSAGSLANFVPSEDGEEATSGEGMDIEPGEYALRVGEKTQLANNTNWAQFLTSVLDCDFPRDKFAPGISFLEGLEGHFNRLPPSRKGGQFGNQANDGKKRDILCLTSIATLPGGKSKAGKSTTTGKPSSKAAADEGGDDDEQDELQQLVARLVKKEGKPVKKSKLANLVLAAFKGSQAEKQKAVKACSDKKFLTSIDGVIYDEDEGTVAPIDGDDD